MKSQQTFLKIFQDLANKGKFVSPRGQLIKEIENYNYVLPPFVRFSSFKSRKLSISYLKKEFLWYLKGDKYDTSITEHASMWKLIMNEDGSFNSNYGQYFFGEKQFAQVVSILKEDKDSRRASILLLTKDHVASKTKDVPCTYALNFRIREGVLNMTVHMRSQDAIYGMGNDAPIFSFIHEMMLNALRRYYPTLGYGNYHHFADSFHIYEKHFNMLANILTSNSFTEISCPHISGPDEVDFLLKIHTHNKEIPIQYQFTKWLMNN